MKRRFIIITTEIDKSLLITLPKIKSVNKKTEFGDEPPPLAACTYQINYTISTMLITKMSPKSLQAYSSGKYRTF